MTIPVECCRIGRAELANSTMITFGQTAGGELSTGWIALVAVVGVIGLLVAIKVGKVILKLIFGLISVALLAGVVWWFFLRH